MTDTSASLVAFVRARIGEERALAEKASPGPWTAGDHLADQCRVEGPGGFTIYDEGGHTEDDAAHIARQDPAATLARCDALTALVSHLETTIRESIVPAVRIVAAATLARLAAFWPNHPDYRQEWAA